MPPVAQLVAQLVDEYGRLDAELKPWVAKLSRKEALAKLLRASITAPSHESATLSGAEYEILAAPCAIETQLAPMPKVYRALGKALFLELCTMTLKALREHAHPEVVAKLTTQEQTGTRRLTAQARQNAMAA